MKSPGFLFKMQRVIAVHQLCVGSRGLWTCLSWAHLSCHQHKVTESFRYNKMDLSQRERLVQIDSFLRSRKYQEDWIGDLYSSICKKGSYYFLPIALEGPQTGAKCGESQHLINIPHSACDQELAGNFPGFRSDGKNRREIWWSLCSLILLYPPAAGNQGRRELLSGCCVQRTGSIR